MRLDKYLADAGIGTRSEVKKLIYWKKVTRKFDTQNREKALQGFIFLSNF